MSSPQTASRRSQSSMADEAGGSAARATTSLYEGGRGGVHGGEQLAGVGVVVEQVVELVPLDLEAGEGGDEVVHVGGGGDIDGQRFLAVPEPAGGGGRARVTGSHFSTGKPCLLETSADWPRSTRRTCMMQAGRRCTQ